MNIGIIGGGSWATALAKLLTHNGHHIYWCLRKQAIIDHIQKRKHNPHYLSSVYFDTDKLRMSTSVQDVIEPCDLVVVCVPSGYLLDTFWLLPKGIFQGKWVLSAIKGVLPNPSHQLLNEFLGEHFGLSPAQYFTVMGPCHAEEVANEKLSYLTFSGESEEYAARIAALFRTDYLRTVVNHDIWGTQYAAVLKNIYAVGAGIAHGLEYGDNFLSVYITNAANEMVGFLRQVMAYKQAPDTGKIEYATSVYLGDLLVTCYSPFSRNRSFGTMIGKGYSVKVAQLEMNMVAEGYPASKGLYEINETVQAYMPIVSTIYQILWGGLPAKEGFSQIEQHLR